jgi:hypothetical protein
MKDDPSKPPNTAPKYLREGIPKQDTETLRGLRDWIEHILDKRELDDDDLSEDAEIVERTSNGTIVEERVKCGDESCSCMSGGEKHGPYKYRYYYQNGDLKSKYLGKVEEQ